MTSSLPSPIISPLFMFFFFNDTATTEIYTLSLHDALPISPICRTTPNRKRAGTCLFWETWGYGSWVAIVSRSNALVSIAGFRKEGRSAGHEGTLRFISRGLVCRRFVWSNPRKKPGAAHCGSARSSGNGARGATRRLDSCKKDQCHTRCLGLPRG